jgi:hypothetical protein
MSANILSDPVTFTEKTYDILVIGGGTAGLALASRYHQISFFLRNFTEIPCSLSDNPKVTIGVLEAGQDLSNDPYVQSAGVSLRIIF